MARRSEHSQEEIKRMVIQAAETIIVEDGLGKLKARNIALEIGYTVGSIYMVFDSMGDLITHLKPELWMTSLQHCKTSPKMRQLQTV